MQTIPGLLLLMSAASCTPSAPESPAVPVAERDIRSVPADLEPPGVSPGLPAPGRRVSLQEPEYSGTDVHHLLYLPRDWRTGGRYPVIVEYAGNGPYSNRFGDISTGYPDGSALGYGISAGRGFLWVCLPYVSKDGQRNARRWWGNLQHTVEYCKKAVPRICARFGGDPNAVILAGFSRGAIATNFIGLHDDEIARLWCGFVSHSHYDGVHLWEYRGSDRKSAIRRLQRLGNRPQWISHEKSVEDTRKFLAEALPDGHFTIRTLPFRNHSDRWVLRDIPLRHELRAFVRGAVGR